MTTDTVRKLYESQNELISHQLTIRQSQDHVLKNIHNSMDELTKEKAMIATGNTELAKLTQNIREKLGLHKNTIFPNKVDFFFFFQKIQGPVVQS